MGEVRHRHFLFVSIFRFEVFKPMCINQNNNQ